mgnify:FL=1
MTVKYLIEKLETMPQDAVIEIEVLTPYCTVDESTESVATSADEVYKGVENNVVIQGVDF